MFYVDNYEIDKTIEELLYELKRRFPSSKLKDIVVKSDQILVTCPHHSAGLEDHPSCFIYTGNNSDIPYGTFHCFTCNCKGNFVKFIAEYLNKPIEFARNWLINTFGSLNKKPLLQLEKIDLNAIKKPTVVNESILDSFKPYHTYLNQRGISQYTCEKFKVKFDPTKGDIVFPVWDIHNRLRFLTRRSVYTKRFIIDKNADKTAIYLLNYVLKEGWQDVVVCESQFNALTCWEYGWPGIALFGAGTTKAQMDVLNATPIRHYILMYDPDEAGRHGAERFKKLIRKDVLVDDVLLPYGKDVNDLSKKEFENLINIYYNDKEGE